MSKHGLDERDLKAMLKELQWHVDRGFRLDRDDILDVFPGLRGLIHPGRPQLVKAS